MWLHCLVMMISWWIYLRVRNDASIALQGNFYINMMARNHGRVGVARRFA